MQNREGVQKGPQDHAEGQHGAKTRSKILEQLHSGNGVVKGDSQSQEQSTSDVGRHAAAHRLFDQRQQHDEAEKNSEKTRLNREAERHNTDDGRASRA
jgi:hypothetical protein